MVARSASRKLFRGALKSLGKSFRMFRLRQGLYLIGPMYIPLTFAFQKVHRFNKKPPPSLPTILSRTLNTAILWFETKRDNTGTPFLMHNSLSPPSSYFVKLPKGSSSFRPLASWTSSCLLYGVPYTSPASHPDHFLVRK